MRKPKIAPVLQIVDLAFNVPVTLVPMVWSEHACSYGSDMEHASGWIPDYEAIKANPAIRAYFDRADKWEIECFPEAIHCALYEGSMRAGQYDAYAYDHASGTESLAFSLTWSVKGNLTSEAWIMSARQKLARRMEQK